MRRHTRKTEGAGILTRQIAVISGKGGAGKTSIAAAIVSLAKDPVIADCDVDASNMHLLLSPEILEKEDFYGLDIAEIDHEACINCGKCKSSCRFDAIDEDINVLGDRCEGCAVCTLECPVNAVSMVPRRSGESYISKTRFGPMVHAELGPGEEASGKLVSDVRKKAVKAAKENGRDLIVIDGPPGSGCEVIATITGVDRVLLVVEPSLSSIHDAKRVLELCDHFRVPVSVVINKFDINEELSDKFASSMKKRGIEITARIPYSEAFTRSMVQGKTVIEQGDEMLIGTIKGIMGSLKLL